MKSYSRVLSRLVVMAFTLITVWGLTSTAWAQAQNCVAPNLLIVVDNSGSMGSSNKWNDAVSATTTIATNFNGKLIMGLETFNSSAAIRYGLPQCLSAGNSCGSQLISTLRNYSPSGGTNLIAAITTAGNHIKSLQPPLSGRRQSILFLTDGQATCANTQVAALRTQNNILTYIIGFGSGVAAACLNDMATAGGTALPGTRKYYQANNLAELQKAMQAIANSASKEVCNNADDDCDGIVDEIKESCQGACGAGTRHCSKGKWSQCSSAKAPEKEVCDNQDNDCDGTVDNNIDPRDCSSVCGKGKERCVAGKWTGCTAPKPAEETCNGKDDNCNGQIDENVRKKCSTKCGAGTQACVQADWSSCSAPQPSAEQCDGVDNDCNGQVDDNINDPLCGRCNQGKCEPKCRAGECLGRKICVDGYCVEKPCEPACASGETCREGLCVSGDCTQPGGECTDGKELCVNKKCVKDPCIGVTCGKDQFCRGGQCIHSCALIQCPQGQLCKNGACQKQPCNGGCQSGTSCVNDKCMPDACSQCAKGQICKGTECVNDLCYGVTCPSGQKCFEGECYGPNGPGTLPTNPDGGPVTPGPDGGTTNPGTDGGTTNPGSDGGTTVPTLDGGNGGTQGKDDGTGSGNGGGRKPVGLCACNASNTPAGLPLSLLLAFLCIPLLRRRED